MDNKNSSSFIHLNGEGYEGLALVLQAAFNQATAGKGKERHAQDLPFDEQPMQTISSLLGTQKGMLFQAVKKIQESTRMDNEAAIKELLGAIVYTAGAVIYLQNQQLNQWKKEAKGGIEKHLVANPSIPPGAFAVKTQEPKRPLPPPVHGGPNYIPPVPPPIPGRGQEPMKPVPPVPSNDNACKSVPMCQCAYTTQAECVKGNGLCSLCVGGVNG